MPKDTRPYGKIKFCGMIGLDFTYVFFDEKVYNECLHELRSQPEHFAVKESYWGYSSPENLKSFRRDLEIVKGTAK